MLKAARIFSSIAASSFSSRKSEIVGSQDDRQQLVSVALFAGAGLLISLLAIILGVQGAWF